MKILLVSGPGISLKEPYNSGIEAFLVSFANQLTKAGHLIDIVAADAEAGANFKLITPFNSAKSDHPGFLTRILQKGQFKNMDTTTYDVIHFNMFYPHLLEVGLNLNKPMFLTLHSPADQKRVAAYRKLSKRGNIAFVAISERIKEQWDLALNQDIPLINNGINMDLWPTKNASDQEYLLWSARINAHKNVADAISLAKDLQLPLKIAGRIADQSYFDLQVKPHLNDQIQYVGHLTQQELSRLATKAIAYLATAVWQEPFGLAPLEMLASGVPVVGYHTAVPPDWRNAGVLTAKSHHWPDLKSLVLQSRLVSPETCNEFAATMSIQHMTSNYIHLYQQRLLQKDLIKE